MKIPSTLRTFAALALAAFVLLVAACRPDEKPATSNLAAHGADLGQTSVSGISSGAYMAGQFQFAHGDIVIGAAIIAGGPYACAESLFADVIPGPGMMLINMSKAVSGCMLNTLWMMGIPNPRLLADRARTLAGRGVIAPIETVTSDRVYLFSGSKDTIVRPPIVAAARDFYRQLGVAEDRIAFVELPAGHAFVTLDRGGACERSEKPFVVDCDYDQAGALLSHIYGTVSPRTAAAGGEFIAFDQREFTGGLGDHGLADTGTVYVPPACHEQKGCRVHVSFHGCSQSRAEVGDAYVTGTALAQWADTNRLIVLFPQVGAGRPTNPQGCWDWWGYTGPEFLTRRAPQIVAVRRMLDRLAAAPE